MTTTKQLKQIIITAWDAQKIYPYCIQKIGTKLVHYYDCSANRNGKMTIEEFAKCNCLI